MGSIPCLWELGPRPLRATLWAVPLLRPSVSFKPLLEPPQPLSQQLTATGLRQPGTQTANKAYLALGVFTTSRLLKGPPMSRQLQQMF